METARGLRKRREILGYGSRPNAVSFFFASALLLYLADSVVYAAITSNPNIVILPLSRSDF
jgi:hypothetical protein